MICLRLHTGLITGIRQNESGLQVLLNSAAPAKERVGQSVQNYMSEAQCALCSARLAMFFLCACHHPARQGSVLEIPCGLWCCGLHLPVTLPWYQDVLDHRVCSEKTAAFKEMVRERNVFSKGQLDLWST